MQPLLPPEYTGKKSGLPRDQGEIPPLKTFIESWYYDSHVMRKFTDIDFMTEAVPDETTLCRFRHLLEANGLNKLLSDEIDRVTVQTGHMIKGGTNVNATVTNAPSSAKNAGKA